MKELTENEKRSATSEVRIYYCEQLCAFWNSSCNAVMHMLFHVRTFFLHNFSQLITRISGAESMML